MRKYLVAFALFFAISVSAQWRPMGGMEGGIVKNLAVAGENIFALTSDSIFVSPDMGASWTPIMVHEKLLNSEVEGIFGFGGNCFVGSKRGLYLSVDGGNNWTLFNNGLPRNSIIIAMTIMGNKFLACTSESMYVSDVSAPNWEKRRGDLPNNIYIRSIITKGNDIYVATFGKGIYRSSDMGETWIGLNEGLTNSQNQKVLSLAFSGGTLLAGTNRSGCWISSSFGRSWTEGNEGLPKKANVNDLLVVGGAVFSATSDGVHITRNQGNSWSSASSGFPEGMAVNALALSGSTIIAGTQGAGILISSNMGGSWQYVNRGLKLSVPVRSVYKADGVFYAGTNGNGIYASYDRGNSWNPINSGLPAKLSVRSIIAKDTLIMIATDNYIYWTKDQGKMWYWNRSGFKSKSVNQLIVLDDKIYAATEDGIYVTNDNGKRWVDKSKMLMSNNINCVASYVTKKKDTVLFIGTKSGMYLSRDLGENWKSFATKALVGVDVTCISPTKGVIFVGTDKYGIGSTNDKLKKLYATKNSGLKYKTLPRQIIFAGRKSYIMASDKGGYLSNNKGKVWLDYSLGLNNLNLYSLFADEDNIYCGNETGNVYFYPIFK